MDDFLLSPIDGVCVERTARDYLKEIVDAYPHDFDVCTLEDRIVASTIHDAPADIHLMLCYWWWSGKIKCVLVTGCWLCGENIQIRFTDAIA